MALKVNAIQWQGNNLRSSHFSAPTTGTILSILLRQFMTISGWRRWFTGKNSVKIPTSKSPKVQNPATIVPLEHMGTGCFMTEVGPWSMNQPGNNAEKHYGKWEVRVCLDSNNESRMQWDALAKVGTCSHHYIHFHPCSFHRNVLGNSAPWGRSQWRAKWLCDANF